LKATIAVMVHVFTDNLFVENTKEMIIDHLYELLLHLCLQVPKQVPKTIESMRVYDETMVAPGDEEVTDCMLL